MMEDLGRPHTWGGSHRQYHYEPLLGPLQPVPPIHVHQSAPPAPLPPLVPQPPQIIQPTVCKVFLSSSCYILFQAPNTGLILHRISTFAIPVHLNTL